MVAWPLPSKRQLAGIGASNQVVAVSATWCSDASVTGPRRRRMLEAASTTSHADMGNLLSLKDEPEEHQTIGFATVSRQKSL